MLQEERARLGKLKQTQERRGQAVRGQPGASAVTLGKSLSIFRPWFAYLQNGPNIRCPIYLLNATLLIVRTRQIAVIIIHHLNEGAEMDNALCRKSAD